MVIAVQARATTLPDACGDDKIKFDVKTEKSKTAPLPPAAGKAQIVFIDNTPMFVQIAEGLGIRSILHVNLKSTCAKLSSFGLQVDEVSNQTYRR